MAKQKTYRKETAPLPTWNAAIQVDFYLDQSPLPGDPACQCSHCHTQLTEENDSGLRLWNNDGTAMAMFCEQCVPKVMQFVVPK